MCFLRAFADSQGLTCANFARCMTMRKPVFVSLSPAHALLNSLPWPNIPCHPFLLFVLLLVCSSCYSCSSSRTHEFLRNLSRNVILCAEVSIPEFMNKARGLLEQFRLHRCVKFPAAILLRYSQKVPNAWSGRTTKPYASKQLQLFWRQRSILANVSRVVDQGGFWWFPSSLDHSPRQGMELLKRRWKWRLAEKGRSRLSRPWICTLSLSQVKSHHVIEVRTCDIFFVQKCQGPLWSLYDHYPPTGGRR